MRNIIINTIMAVAAVVAAVVPVVVYIADGQVDSQLIIKSIMVVIALLIAIKKPGKVIRKPTIEEMRSRCPDTVGNNFQSKQQERLIRDAYYHLTCTKPRAALQCLKKLEPLCERAAELGTVHYIMSACYESTNDADRASEHLEQAKLYRPDLFAEAK